MKMKRNRLLDVLHTAREIDDRAGGNASLGALSAHLGQFGFSACLITRLPLTDAPNWEENVLANHWPQEWYHRYMCADHFRHDPCVAKCRRTALPFLWSEVEKTRLAMPARRVMQDAYEYGLRQGICVPFHAPFEPPTVLTVSGESADLAPSTLRIVGLLAYQVLQSVLRNHSPVGQDPQSALSAREREVMRWVADGKTAWEVSCILSLSEHTVLTHQRNARRKLDATNNVHAVVKAFLRQEIEI